MALLSFRELLCIKLIQTLLIHVEFFSLSKGGQVRTFCSGNWFEFQYEGRLFFVRKASHLDSS